MLAVALVAGPVVACGGSERVPTPPPSSTATGPALLASLTSEPSPTPAETRTGATATPDATPSPAGGQLHFDFDRRASGGDRALVQRGVEHAARYLLQAAGVPTVEAHVFLYESPLALAAALHNSPVALSQSPQLIAERLWVTMAETVPGAILIASSSPGWQALDDVNRFRVAAHEYFHAVQMDRMGEELARRMATAPIDEERPEGPSWLFEGGAEYVSFKALEAAGLADLSAYLQANPLAPGADLRDVETFLEYASGQPDGLVLPLAGVHLLLEAGDPGPLVRFYELLGRGRDWRQAFRDAFGRGVEAFYEEFDARYRP